MKVYEGNKDLKHLLELMQLFHEMDYLTDYIHSLTYDPTLEEITTIKELVECFETELYYIQQDLEELIDESTTQRLKPWA